MEQLERLKEITRILREPGGCDWDRAQDFHSIRTNVIEEAYEVVDAVNRESAEDLREELGDLLFQVIFYSRLAQEKGLFALEDVTRTIADKLVRRHPHVFGDSRVEGVEEILTNWEKIKRQEKGESEESPERKSALDGVAETLPALFRAYKVQEKAARTGFDWSETDPVMEKIHEELRELEEEIRQFRSLSQSESARSAEEGDSPVGASAEPFSHTPSKMESNLRHKLEEEMGDLLFSMVNLSRHLKMNPELVMNRAVDKFTWRFRHMEELARESGESLESLSLSQKEELWQRVKGFSPPDSSSETVPTAT